LFAQGYGEENDFCLRARHLGWRHVALPGLFVAHCGGASFGRGGWHLQVRNRALLNRLHPGYEALIQAFSDADPLAPARRRLDAARWRAVRPRPRESVILITHNDGGGVERCVERSAAEHVAAGKRAVLLRPRQMADKTPAVVVGEGPAGDFPNLCYRLPDELPSLLRQLRSARPGLIEVHHFLDHPPAIYQLIAQLDRPYDVHVHDYAWFCPRIALVGRERRYCGEPDLEACENCVADTGRFMAEEIRISALRQRSARFLTGARRVLAPSQDAAARMRRHFPGLRVVVTPHEDDTSIAELAPSVPQKGICRVCVIGGIGVHKGYDILLACARDAASRSLPLEFIVVGSTIDDDRLLATDRVFVTGGYKPDEVVDLIRDQQASLALLPRYGRKPGVSA